MRKSSVGLIFVVLLFTPIYFSKEITAFAGFPDMRWGTARAVVALFAVVFAVVVLGILTLVNPRILAWRKAKGRDIEDEERYESDQGMISLKPKDEE